MANRIVISSMNRPSAMVSLANHVVGAAGCPSWYSAFDMTEFSDRIAEITERVRHVLMRL
jgi:hypothetical protein